MTLAIASLLPALDVKTAKGWTGTIYIRADGSVDPSDAPVEKQGRSYLLTANVTTEFDGIVVETDDATLDGSGHTVQGSGNHGGINTTYGENITIKDFTIRSFNDGIYFKDSVNCTIIGNNVSGITLNGILLVNSSNDSIRENNLEACRFGINSTFCSDNNITGNRMIKNNQSGLLLQNSLGNYVARNCFANNSVAVHAFGGLSSDNYVFGNVIAANNIGMLLDWDIHNVIVANNITSNTNGLEFFESTRGQVFHNNFVKNDRHVTCDGYSVAVFDDGYPSGGNYWSGYKGADLYSGPCQNETGSDGIGDSPYSINWQNLDRYPLMNSGQSSSIFIEKSGNQTYPVEVFTNATVQNLRFNGTTGEISLNLLGESGKVGYCRLIFPKEPINGTLAVLVNGTAIAHSSAENSTHCFLSFTHHLSLNNIRIFETVLGDVNGDKKVDIQDVAQVSAAFGSIRVIDSNDPKFNQYWHSRYCHTCPHAATDDINRDNKIDVQDLARTSANFGKCRL